jgi:prefoldin alpha subunit
LVASEDEIREMLTILDRYKYQVDLMGQQLNMLSVTEQELGAAWDFLESFEKVEDGSDVMVPVGGGVFVTAKVSRVDKVLASVGDSIVAELDPGDAAKRIGERRDQVREMMQQVKAGIQQTEAQATALSQQAEAAFQELQASRGGATD